MRKLLLLVLVVIGTDSISQTFTRNRVKEIENMDFSNFKISTNLSNNITHIIDSSIYTNRGNKNMTTTKFKANTDLNKIIEEQQMILNNLKKIRSSQNPEFSIQEIDNGIEILENLIDSCDRLRAKYLINNRMTFFSFFNTNKTGVLLDYLYDSTNNKVRFINESNLNYGLESISIFSELIAFNLSPIRISAGAQIEAQINDSTNNSNQSFHKLMTNGGNFAIKVESPIFMFRSRKNIHGGLFSLNFKTTFDFPQLNKYSPINSIPMGHFFGFNFHYEIIPPKDDNFKIVFRNKFNYVLCNDRFKEKAGLSTNSFPFNITSLDLVFAKVFSIKLIVPWTIQEDNFKQNMSDVLLGGGFIK